MKKFALVIASVLVVALLLSGCDLLGGRTYYSDYDYSDSYDYDYDNDYDYDYNYDDDDDYDYNYGTSSSDFDGFWERTESYAKVGLFVYEGEVTIFIASLGEQYTVEMSTTLDIVKSGSSFYLYQDGVKEGKMQLLGSNTIYITEMDSFNGSYKAVSSLDIDLD